MSVTFSPRIHWPNGSNELLLPANYYRLQVPAGLSDFDVRAPNFVNVEQMRQASQSGVVQSSGRQLPLRSGLVTQELEVRFANPAGQWRRLPDAGRQPSTHGPGRFQFLGGEVFLHLTLGMYILDTCKPDADPISVEIFAAVYGHELLHVLDDIDIVTKWLPSQLIVEPMILRHLVRAQPFVYGTPTQRIHQVEQEFRRYIQNTIHSTIRDGLWAVEVNRRGSLRDAPSEYRIVQERVDNLRARQINR